MSDHFTNIGEILQDCNLTLYQVNLRISWASNDRAECIHRLSIIYYSDLPSESLLLLSDVHPYHFHHHYFQQDHNPTYSLVSPSSLIATTPPSFQNVLLQTGNFGSFVPSLNWVTFNITDLVTFQTIVQPFRLPSRCLLPYQYHQAVQLLNKDSKSESGS